MTLTRCFAGMAQQLRWRAVCAICRDRAPISVTSRARSVRHIAPRRSSLMARL